MNDVQRCELNVYKEIAKVCDRHSLKYYAIGGTCIGAIRHSGFIPWDDDIDIAMPRSDYNQLCNCFYDELPSYIAMMNHNTTNHFPYLFTKFHDTRTALIGVGFYGERSLYTGAFVDVMPIDGLPTDEVAQKKLLNRVSWLGWLYYKSRNLPSKDKSLSGRVKHSIRRLSAFVLSNQDLPSKIEKMLSEFSFEDSHDCVFTWRAYDRSLRDRRLVFLTDWFSDTIVVPFEDAVIPVPIHFHQYLTQDFGDYMVLPPNQERDSGHDIYISDMERSYREYL